MEPLRSIFPPPPPFPFNQGVLNDRRYLWNPNTQQWTIQGPPINIQNAAKRENRPGSLNALNYVPYIPDETMFRVADHLQHDPFMQDFMVGVAQRPGAPRPDFFFTKFRKPRLTAKKRKKRSGPRR